MLYQCQSIPTLDNTDVIPVLEYANVNITNVIPILEKSSVRVYQR